MAMLMPADRLYKQSKRIKAGLASLDPEYRSFADWLEGRFSVRVVNVQFVPERRKRFLRAARPAGLHVVVESSRDRAVFAGDTSRGFISDVEKMRMAAAEFRRRTAGVGLQNSQRDPTVSFSDFESAARREALFKVSFADRALLSMRLKNRSLWRIHVHPITAAVTFFFLTEADRLRHETRGYRDIYSREYGSLVAPHDEFGYFRARGVEVHLDSKENFETTFEGNWFFYDRS